VHGANPGSHEVLSLFQRADVVCLPTHVDAVPWAVVEALACGVPVVATRVGSIAEMVGPRSGLLVAPGDIRGLREALHTIVEDPARRSAMGAAARDRAERAFDARRNTASMLERLVAVAASARADAFAAS
jgi:MMP alpha-(1->4)-mannosyltransferase